jgi:hypothetical protein
MLQVLKMKFARWIEPLKVWFSTPWVAADVLDLSTAAQPEPLTKLKLGSLFVVADAISIQPIAAVSKPGVLAKRLQIVRRLGAQPRRHKARVMPLAQRPLQGKPKVSAPKALKVVAKKRAVSLFPVKTKVAVRKKPTTRVLIFVPQRKSSNVIWLPLNRQPAPAISRLKRAA